MEISRRNVLDLIGKNASKYHSCVLCCYALDIACFEERILPKFRAAGIKNVNILADGNYLEHAQEATTGREFRHGIGYSFQGVYEQGVFHPKILLLAGKTNGLLLVGSGNITSAGLSTNDEVWGAFHLNSIENDNAPLFGAVWKYLQPYLEQTVGFMQQKLEWMRKYSPWLEELPIETDFINLSQLGLDIQFVGNTAASSTFTEIDNSITEDTISTITTISPFYNAKGDVLEALSERYKPTTLNCIIEPNSGTLPTNLGKTTPDPVRFYSWADCVKDYEDNVNRLHAKMLHFVGEDNEYLYLGSANATREAMGLQDVSASNAEAGILLKRPRQEKNWLEELKITIPKQETKLEELEERRALNPQSINRNKTPYKVLYAEIYNDKLTVFCNKELEEELLISVVSRDDSEERIAIDTKGKAKFEVKISHPEEVFKVYLTNNKQEQLSNYILVHNVASMLKSNPDTTNQKLDELLESDFTDGEGISDLLGFIEFDWSDGENTHKTNTKFGVGGAVRHKEETEKDYDVLTEDEFNTVSNEILLKQSGELASSVVRIAEFLRIYSGGLTLNTDDFEESEEQRLLQDKEQQGEGDELKDSEKIRTTGSKEKAAIRRFLSKLDQVYAASVTNLIQTKALTETPKEAVTIRLLSSMQVALHLFQIKYGKRFTIVSNEVDEYDEPIKREEHYITEGESTGKPDTLKGFLVDTLGKFLLKLTADDSDYQYEVQKEKFARSKRQLCETALALALLANWKRGEDKLRNVLLFNILHFTLGEELLNEKQTTNLTERLDKLALRSPFTTRTFTKNYELFTSSILPRYVKWINTFSHKTMKKDVVVATSSLKKGQIVFSSKIGFNVVMRMDNSGHLSLLDLMRPGYPAKKDFTLRKVQYPPKAVILP
jgi:hypothetical protein